jgi:hypothetical protein
MKSIVSRVIIIFFIYFELVNSLSIGNINARGGNYVPIVKHNSINNDRNNYDKHSTPVSVYIIQIIIAIIFLFPIIYKSRN